MNSIRSHASPIDMWLRDDFHYNGAFRLMYTFSWLLHHSRPKSEAARKNLDSFYFQTTDGQQFFLDLGPIKNVNEKYFKKLIPTWNEYLSQGDYDSYWQSRNCLKYLKNINHPVLIVTGWFDAEDFFGPLNLYQTIENHNSYNQTNIVIGPWKHSGWNRMEGDRLGDIEFGQPTEIYFRENIDLPFLIKHLKQEVELKLPEAFVFKTGSNQWISYN